MPDLPLDPWDYGYTELYPVNIPATPSCVVLIGQDFETIRLCGGDVNMFPQPEEIIDEVQKTVEQSPDAFSKGEFALTLEKLEECALLSQDEIELHGEMYHSCLVHTYPNHGTPRDYDEWAELNRELWRKYRERQKEEQTSE